MASYYSGYSNYYRLRLDVTQGTQSIANNTTSVSWALYLETTTAYFQLHSISGTYVNINGSRAWTAGTNQISLPGYNSTTKLASGTKTVTHNSNGTKTVPLYVYYTMPDSASYLPGNMSISASMTLSTIARVSNPTLSSSSAYIGDDITINFNRQSSNFTHSVWWRLSEKGSWTQLWDKTTKESVTWETIQWVVGLLGSLPNSNSGLFEVYVSTYNGDIELGHKILYVTLKIPEGDLPGLGNIIVSETNSVVGALGVDYFIAGVSTFKVSVSDHYPSKLASFKNAKFKLGGWGWKTTSATSTTFGASGQWNPEVTAIVTDSRGRSTSKTIKISQTPYSVPSIIRLSASRYNREDRTQVQIVLKATQTKLSNKNTMRYKLEYKKSTETSWKQLKAYSSYQSNDFNETVTQTIPNDSGYNIRASVQDKLGNTTTSIYTVKSTSRKWLEVTNGEDINVIGNLMNNSHEIPFIQTGSFQKDRVRGKNSVHTINFPKAFRETYFVNVTPWVGDASTCYISVGNITNTSFQFITYSTIDSPGTAFRWVAIGN